MYINDEKIGKKNSPQTGGGICAIYFQFMPTCIADNNADISRVSAFIAIFAFYAMTDNQAKTNIYNYIIIV